VGFCGAAQGGATSRTSVCFVDFACLLCFGISTDVLEKNHPKHSHG
jgi:hypothetical protein